MAAKIFGNTFVDVGTAISLPIDCDVEISENLFRACKKAIEIRDPRSFLSALGLDQAAPIQLVRELLEPLGTKQSVEATEVKRLVESSGVLAWMAAGSNMTTIVSGLVQLTNSHLVQAALSMLPR